jgi:hypothetical protein
MAKTENIANRDVGKIGQPTLNGPQAYGHDHGGETKARFEICGEVAVFRSTLFGLSLREGGVQGR